MKKFIIPFILCLAFASHAFADDICSDRPGKSAAPCTVPQGAWQVESDSINTTYYDQDGVKNITTVVLDPTYKYGLTNNLDAELSITPYEYSVNNSQHFSGVGDSYFKLKYEYKNTGNLTLAVSPFVKIPTADHHLGNGAWEGGIQFPISYTLNDKWSIEGAPEVDFLKDKINDGRHVAFQDSIDLVRALPYNISFTFELWAYYEYDVVQTKQYSLDLSAGWIVHHDLQLDAGINFGLSKDTPQAQVFFGMSKRF